MATKKAAKKAAAKKTSRCWPGYEPVKGKAQNEQGSCKKKAASKSSASDKKAQADRKKQLDQWQKAHPKSPKKAAQHLPKAKKAAKSAK